MNAKFSVSEIKNLVAQFNLRSLPNTGRAIQYRAQNENWAFEEVPSQGGKKGVKRVYPLPVYVIDELEEKGLLHLIESGLEEAPQAGTLPSESNIYKEKEAPAAPRERTEFTLSYSKWAEKQERGNIVPVRYYKEVFASAGNGAIPWDNDPEAMWFRDSFFKYLGLKPADCFCTRVDGDSMHPTLIDQGTVLWHAVTQYTREGIYLFRQGDELRVKRLQRLNINSFNVISDNPNKGIYPTTSLDLSQAEPHDFEILGRYLWSCGIAK